jgi:hypothetical protein
MWIKKSANEVRADRDATRRRHLLAGLGVLLLLYAIVSSRPGWSLPPAIRIPAALFAGFLLLAWYQRARWKRVRSTVQICDRCNKVNSSDGKGECVCGGKFTPLASMKWVDSPVYQTDRIPTDQPKVLVSGAA